MLYGGGDAEGDDLSPDGAIAERIRSELAALQPLPDALFAVLETDDGRGMGLFVAGQAIEAGTYLFDYAGKLIEQWEYDELYPRAHASGPFADYAVGILMDDGRSVYVDAADPRESNLARFMNHDAVAPNCHAWTLTNPVGNVPPRVLIFVGIDVAPGEELVWDYGDEYWKGRNDMR